MTGDKPNARWQQVSRLCHDALECDATEREQFLREACAGDEALRRDVESLLANQGEAREFLNDGSSDLVGGQIGVYRITSLLGVGGMGEVYRARDTTLGRDVAIKVLPTAFTTDAGRLARFKREAQLLASLNHPHIGAIHGFDDSSGSPALILELVEGETLADRLERGPLPIAEALNIARQIADALEAAHDRGIVHRDLKPANIKITPAGTAKVLDFGLAKSSVAAGVGSESLTAHSAGQILGTAAYMSPDQARGKPVDKRADVWAFGCVLFEMLSGRPAFSGETVTDTIAAVVQREPDWAQLPETTPPTIRQLLLRCLQKDSGRRLRDIGDARLELDEEDPSRRAGMLPVRRRLSGRAVGLTLALCGTIAAVPIGVAIYRLTGAARQPPQRPALTSTPLTTYPGLEYDPSFSPDGSQVAFAWSGPQQDNWDIYVKVAGSAAEPLRLTSDPAPDRFPAWSPDGREIAFGRGKALFLISPLGGPERKLADFEVSSQMSWSPDGKWIAATELGGADRPGGISLIPRDGVDVRRVTSRRLPFEDHSPTFSPGGKWLAFGACIGGFYTCDVYASEMGKSSPPNENLRRLTRQGMVFGGLAWMPDAETILYSAALPGPGNSRLNYRLWRLGISSSSDPEPVNLAANPSMLAISKDGHRLAYAQVQTNTEIWTFENGKSSRSPLSSTGGEVSPTFSADGTRIAFVSNRSGNAEIWVAKADGSQPMQLTSSGKEVCGTPRWSPDGRWLAYDRLTIDGLRHTFVIDSAGGHPRRLVEHRAPDRVPSWSWDGRFIYFSSSSNAGKDEIFRVPAAGGTPIQMTDQGGYVAFESLDGQTLYYTKTPGGSSPLFARRLSGGSERQVLESVYGRALVVAARGIYYIEQAGADGKFPLKSYQFASGTSSLVTLIDADVYGGLAVSGNEKQVLYVINTPRTADLELVENFQ